MDAVVLALCSAALFGGMTVALRPALARGDDPLVGALFTVAAALCVALVAAAVVGDWDVAARVAVRARRDPRARASRRSCSRSRSATPARRARRRRSGWRRSSRSTFAVVLLGEPLVAGIALGAVLIVAGGLVLASESGRPEHVKTIGLVLALAAALVFALRDTFVRWVAVDTDVAPELAISATLLAGALTILVAAARRPPAPAACARWPAFLPGRAAVRALLRLALRGVLPRPPQRRRAARGDGVAVGRRALGALPAPRRGRRAAARARRAASSSPAGS